MKALLTAIALISLVSCEDMTTSLVMRETNTFTDMRGGHVYKMVTIGDQTWMAENLNYVPAKFIADAQYYKTDEFGVFYNYPALSDISPEGWHIPTDKEWNELTEYLGGDSIAGGKLRLNRFNPLLGGFIQSEYGWVNTMGVWWSSTEYHNDYAWARYINHTSDYLLTFNVPKVHLANVRCVKN